jgi:hypothetical protein
MRRITDHDGWRSNVSARSIRHFANDAGLAVTKQLQFWDDKKEFGVPRFNDCISIISKPSVS